MKKLLFTLFVFILLVEVVSAQNFDSYNTEIDIDNGLATIYSFGSYQTNNINLEIKLLPNIKDLSVIINEEEVTCQSEEGVGYTLVTCPTDKDNINSFIELNYVTKYPVINLGEKNLINFKEQINSEVYNLKLTLDKGTIVSDTNLITPDTDNLYSDGKHIILSWEITSLEQPFEISVLTEEVNQSSNWFLFVIMSLIVLSVIGGIISLSLTKRKKVTMVIADSLLENEQKVVEILTKSGKEFMWQKELQIKTELSKVKLSRLLKSMEKRNLIEREPFGNTKKIKLAKKQEDN